MSDERLFVLHAFARELAPAGSTLAALAGWLAQSGDQWGPIQRARDGERLSASILRAGARISDVTLIYRADPPRLIVAS